MLSKSHCSGSGRGVYEEEVEFESKERIRKGSVRGSRKVAS